MDPPNKKLTYRHFLLKVPRLIDETPCIYRHHVEPRVHHHVLHEGSFPIPLKYKVAGIYGLGDLKKYGLKRQKAVSFSGFLDQRTYHF